MRSEERALDGFWGSFIHYLDLLKGIPKSSRHLLSEQPQGTPEFVESPAPETKQATGENSVTDAQKHPFESASTTHIRALPFKTMRRHGRRLARAYGWDGEVFVLE
ncbi:hypothetical protein NKR19_g2429 [Coniochaeta hoffmannii]|uniref:Uncharacterized protein n=1 Tax=Coniochaeta hoffmannii TaxID=91930 RepID=A0AA38S5I9_9PEZI|nr:hypothetical protein NKR19_g2429 [Coniochaeta hoffmannii]